MPTGTIENLALAQWLIDALDEASGLHPGFRPVHAKGLMCSGTFTPSPDAIKLTRAPHASRASTPVTVRYSDFTGLPNIPDNDPQAEPKGMAIRFHLGEHVHTDIVAHSVNGFPVHTGEEFVEFLRAATAFAAGRPEGLQSFLASHPNAKRFVEVAKPIPTSFAREAFFAVTSFAFTNADGVRRHGRFRIRPEAGTEYLSNEEAAAKSPSFLFDEIGLRLAKGPVKLGVFVQMAEPGDDVTDASMPWPENRTEIEFGTITLTARVDDQVPERRKIIFDPLPRVDGIDSSGDPLTQVRADTYLLSGRRRRAATSKETRTKESIGNFLLRRLEEAGVKHIFGVPGDYNLELLRQLEERGKPAWVGNCNELNASYATDGYARLNGIGALIVTNGVGALSALNGVAGAYSEHVPLVCVCGSIPARAVQHGDLMHHTLADREKGNFYRAFAEVTTAQTVLTTENAASEIDRLILTAWRRKLPVYMELPSDLAYLEIEVPDGRLELTMPPSDSEGLRACTQVIADRLSAAKAPAFLLDLDTDRFALSQQVVDLAERFQMRVCTMSTSKGVFSETSPLFAGPYAGSASPPEARKAVEESDCLIAIGYRRVELATGFFTDKLPPTAIYLNSTHVDAGGQTYEGVHLAELMDSLVQSSKSMPARKAASAGAAAAAAPTPRAAAPGGPLNQKSYWQAMQSFLRPGDVILAEDGTSIVGAGELRLPDCCTFVSQAIWGSIGYTVGALLGALLAAPGRRHILFVGEGSFHLTAQELSTILHHDLKPYIFLINNKGYTIERAILGKDAKYNDVPSWRYAELPRVFRPGGNAESYVVKTVEDLQKVLEAEHAGLVFVEAVMDKYDAPVDLIRTCHTFAVSNYGPRGPQTAPGAQLEIPNP